MRFISPRVHGALDYAVAAALVGAPLAPGFAAESAVAVAISIAAGIALAAYSLLTDYSAGLRRWIPWRVHLALDSIAALALLGAPFAFGFGGVPRAFFVAVAVAVLGVVAASQPDTRRFAAAACAALVIALGSAGIGAHGDATAPSYDADGSLRQPEDRAWREWVHLGTPLTPNSLNPPVAPFPEFHNVYIRPADFEHYARTGSFRDGTLLIKELVSVGATQARSGNGFFEGEFIGLEAAVKDSRRFPDEPGYWAYFTFNHEGPPYPKTAKRQPTATCNGCHQAGTQDGSASDFVFVSYYPVLRAARR